MSIQNERGSSERRENNIVICDRKKISLTGIDEVASFDENTVVLSSGNDIITVDGSGLNITKLSLETGDVVIEGQLGGLFYSQSGGKKNGFFSRFRQ